MKFAGGEKAIKLFKTQAEAVAYTKEMAKNQDGKMLVHNSKGENKGKIKKKIVFMKILEDAILQKGRILDNDIIKVDAIINHQVDVPLMVEIAKEVKKEFPHVDKVLTIVTSGLPFAFALAEQYGVDMVFAKKEKSKTVDLSTCIIEEILLSHMVTSIK